MTRVFMVVYSLVISVVSASYFGPPTRDDWTWRALHVINAVNVAAFFVLHLNDWLSAADARTILRAWVEHHRHDRCWYYPDIFRRLCRSLGVDAEPGERCSRDEFEAGCHRFTDEEFGPR